MLSPANPEIKAAVCSIFSSSSFRPLINGIRMLMLAPVSDNAFKFSRICRLLTPVYFLCFSSSIIFRSNKKWSVLLATLSKVSFLEKPEVSTTRCIFRKPHSSNNLIRKPEYISGSPPEKVTPPPDCSINTRSFSIASIIHSTDINSPDISVALVGQTSAHLPQSKQAFGSVIILSCVNLQASSGQASTHSPQPMHLLLVYIFCTFGD